MSEASTSCVFNTPVNNVFKVIADYSQYPKFLSEVKGVKIVEAHENKKLVEFEVQILKTFKYQLWLNEMPPQEITWTFHGGDIFKDNFGSWKLKDLGNGKTEAHYTISAKFSMFVPGMIEKKVIQSNLPSMIKSFKEKIEAMR